VYSCKYHVIFCHKYRRKILDVHLLLDVNLKDNITEIVNKIKGYTSFGLSLEFSVFRKPFWSQSKFISSVGAVTLDVVKKYIEDQK
jgi:putative transposase